MKSMSLCALFAIVIFASAAAQVTPKYADWADSPVKFLMTRDETKQWKAIRSDDEAAAFIDLFWARRDPTPATPRNEFREEFDQRVAVADERFAGYRTRGALTDRGKVLILLGPPEQMSGRYGEASITSLNTGTTAQTDSEGHLLVPSPTREPPRQVWTYAHQRKPKFIKESDFVLVFLDVGHNDWQLGHTERTNPDVILMQAVNGLIVSPNLTKAPFSSSTPTPTLRAHATSLKDLALDTAVKQFKAGDKPAVGPATLTWGEFVSPAGEHFVSVQLYVPAGSEITAGQKVTFFGVIEKTTGEIVEVAEDATSMIASGRDAYVDKSLQLAPGSYTGTFGIAAGGHVLSASRTGIKVEGLDPAATGISPLILSNNVYPMQTAYDDTDPFTFGGLKVVPKGDSVFTPSGDLWYFVEMRNPGVAEGNPKVQVQVDIKGKTSKGPVAMSLPMKDAEVAKLKGMKDRYAVGLAIPLEGFVPGEYTMKVRVVDTVLGKTYDLERQFRVQAL